MAAKKKKHHIVPKCYLANFTDSRSPPGHQPYVWVIRKDDLSVSKRAPSNLLTSNDVYSIHLDDGTRSLVLEDSLAHLESQFARLYRAVIRPRLSMTAEQKLVLAAFTTAMLMRTMTFKETIDRFHDEILDKMRQLEERFGTGTASSEHYSRQFTEGHAKSLLSSLPQTAEVVYRMNFAFLHPAAGERFVTSDVPAFLFNPHLEAPEDASPQMRALFTAPGLAQRDIYLLFPLAPDTLLCARWMEMKEQAVADKEMVEFFNRLTWWNAREVVLQSTKPTLDAMVTQTAAPLAGQTSSC
jgi:hypothetical protein